MIILRINNELCFASDIVSTSIIDKAQGKGFSKKDFDEAFLQFIFFLESCEEAIEMFDEFIICPVCGAQENNGLMVHRDKRDFVQ